MRIAILGPESSGKTTLAKNLSTELNCTVVYEYAREYFQNKDYSLCELKDLIFIAEEQYKRTENHEQLISDTDIITIEVWAEDKYRNVPERIKELAYLQYFDVYILAFPDIPWVYDKLRTDVNRRQIIFQKYIDKLNFYNIEYIVVKGSIEGRIKRILEYVNENGF